MNSLIPDYVIEQICKLVSKFLWNGKKPKSKHSTLIGQSEDRGLNLHDFIFKLKAIKLAWVQKCFNKEEQA